MTTKEKNKSMTIVIKLGTSSICDEKTHEPLISILSQVVETAVRLRREGNRVIIVSSGAIGIGLRRLDIDKRPKHIAAAQAIAAVGQCRLIALWDELFKQLRQPIAQILITRNDVDDRNRYRNAARCIAELLNMGIIPIVNENDTLAVSEIKFGDNDTLSATTAGMVGADYLFLMTDVDCLYTNNPRTHPDATPIEVVEDVDALEVDVSSAGSAVGTGGMATKLTAARLAAAAGVMTFITRSSTPSNIFHIVKYVQHLKPARSVPPPSGKDNNAGIAASVDVSGRTTPNPESANRPQTPGTPHPIIPGPTSAIVPPLHTRFLPKPRPHRDRHFWLLYGIKRPRGTIYIDAGAYAALTRADKAGLLPIGVLGIAGEFNQQDPVSIILAKKLEDGTIIPEANEVGRALVNYKSSEVAKIAGHKGWEISEILGYADSDYVAHRDNTAFYDFPSVHHGRESGRSLPTGLKSRSASGTDLKSLWGSIGNGGEAPRENWNEG